VYRVCKKNSEVEVMSQLFEYFCLCDLVIPITTDLDLLDLQLERRAEAQSRNMTTVESLFSIIGWFKVVHVARSSSQH
jgi:hypothetical protein